jgi:hypothetical protein
MSENFTNETQSTPLKSSAISRHHVFVLIDGTFVVRWQTNRVQELETGAHRSYVKADYGAPVTDYELKQLQSAGIVERFDDESIWLNPSPPHYQVQYKTLWEQMRSRAYYLHTMLSAKRLGEVTQALAQHELNDVFYPRIRDSFVVLWGHNGRAFHNFEDAEALRNSLLSLMPELLADVVVAFVETSMK